MSDLLSTRHDDGRTSNQTFEDYTGIDATVVIICDLKTPLMVISIIVNGLVLAAIIRTPSIRSNSMIMLSSLAVSDLLVGVIAQPLFIANKITKSCNVFVYNLAFMTGYSLCGVSLGTITAISLDRFMALHYHMRYATLVTKCRVQCIVMMIWLTILVLPSFNLWNERTFHLLVAVLNVICSTISTFCYARIYRIVRCHQSQIDTQQQAVQSSKLGNNFNMLRLKRSARNTFAFFIVLISCYFPMFIILTLYDRASYTNWIKGSIFAITIVFMNSSINPVLYCWRLGELRAAVIKTTRQMICKQAGQN